MCHTLTEIMNASLKAGKGWHRDIHDDSGEVWCQEPKGGMGRAFRRVTPPTWADRR